MADSMEARFARLVQRSDALKASAEEKAQRRTRARERAALLYGELVKTLGQFDGLATPAGVVKVESDVDNALAVAARINGRDLVSYSVEYADDPERPEPWVAVCGVDAPLTVLEAAADLMTRIEGLY